MLTFPPAPLQTIRHSVCEAAQVSLSVLRTDLIDPYIQGNKWYKLRYFLQEALQQNHDTILTFGGAFSNHIFATARTANLLKIKSICIIRGEQTLPLNPVLDFAQKQGMQLHYWDRTSYRQKESAEMLEKLEKQFGKFYLIPEGGFGILGLQGAKHILDNVPKFDVLAAACGTGTMAAGLIAACSEQTQKLFFAALKGNFLEKNINDLLEKYQEKKFQNWEVCNAYHFGGYAKQTPQLWNFIADFYEQTHIRLEPIYTAKLFFGLLDKIKNGDFLPKTNILAIHSGGVYPLYADLELGKSK